MALTDRDGHVERNAEMKVQQAHAAGKQGHANNARERAQQHLRAHRQSHRRRIAAAALTDPRHRRTSG